MSEYNEALEAAAQVIELASLLPDTENNFNQAKVGCAAILADRIRAIKRPEIQTPAPITDEETEAKWAELTAGPYNFDRVIEGRRRLVVWAYERGKAETGRLQDYDANKVFLVRASVVNLAVNMEERLRANDHKDGWDQMGLLPLYAKLGEEVGELGKLLFYGHSNNGQSLFEDFQPDQIKLEAADVANIAMMITEQAERFELNTK